HPRLRGRARGGDAGSSDGIGGPVERAAGAAGVAANVLERDGAVRGLAARRGREDLPSRSTDRDEDGLSAVLVHGRRWDDVRIFDAERGSVDRQKRKRRFASIVRGGVVPFLAPQFAVLLTV